jgi:hypothetical protein
MAWRKIRSLLRIIVMKKCTTMNSRELIVVTDEGASRKDFSKQIRTCGMGLIIILSGLVTAVHSSAEAPLPQNVRHELDRTLHRASLCSWSLPVMHIGCHLLVCLPDSLLVTSLTGGQIAVSGTQTCGGGRLSLDTDFP